MDSSDWGSDVCSSDRGRHALEAERGCGIEKAIRERADMEGARDAGEHDTQPGPIGDHRGQRPEPNAGIVERPRDARSRRSEEHTSELQSLMRISYAVFCLKKKNNNQPKKPEAYHT